MAQAKQPELDEYDRALRDLSKRMEGRGEEEFVRLTVRDVRALVARAMLAQKEAEAAAKSARRPRIF